MSYVAPTREQRFVLDHIAGIGSLASAERFAAAESDMIDAILEGIAAFAQDRFAPLNRVGDTVPV
jgi:hypothetical protein